MTSQQILKPVVHGFFLHEGAVLLVLELLFEVIQLFDRFPTALHCRFDVLRDMFVVVHNFLDVYLIFIGCHVFYANVLFGPESNWEFRSRDVFILG